MKRLNKKTNDFGKVCKKKQDILLLIKINTRRYENSRNIFLPKIIF